MDLLLIIAGVVLLLAGIVGCVLPFLPGPPLAYASLLLLQVSSRAPFSSDFLLLWAGIALLVTLLDYWVPIYGTKKFGGSKKGVWGATIGLLVGLFFFPPFGLIIGPFLGALAGELLDGQEASRALKAAFGSFIGLLAGTVMKLVVSFIIGYHFLRGAILF